MRCSAARIAVVLLVTVVVVSGSRAQEGEAPAGSPGSASSWDGESAPGHARAAYALDAISRIVPDTGHLRCDTTSLVDYRGTSLRFQARVRVHAAFIPVVQRFETLVQTLAREVYGRAPRSLAHAGAYNCRRIRRATTTMSEHALGNALDVRGFDFYGASRGEPLPDGVPVRFARSFRIRVEDHWATTDPRYAVHVTFFERLRERLEAEPDLFTVMLGPSFPGHRNHLHFDRAPWRFVQF